MKEGNESNNVKRTARINRQTDHCRGTYLAALIRHTTREIGNPKSFLFRVPNDLVTFCKEPGVPSGNPLAGVAHV